MRRGSLRLFSVLVLTALVVSSGGSAQQTANVTKTVATIPVEVRSYGWLFLKARVNGVGPMSFVLDSGASAAFIVDAQRALSLGLNPRDQVTVGGGAGSGSYEVAHATNISFEIAGLTFQHEKAAVIALRSLESLAGR